MRLKIRHTTHYNYESAPSFLVQRLHLHPSEFETQKTVSWAITAPGIENAVRYVDGFGNIVYLTTAAVAAEQVTVSAEGEVETTDAAGIVRGLQANIPDAVFLRRTTPTTAGPQLLQFAEKFNSRMAPLERAHAIMNEVHARIAYETGTSDAHTTAAEAFSEGRGVCQDHAHVMIAVARTLGIPARYVTGYLVTGVGASSTAAHAWAELLVPELGWIGFDAANGQCPTEHYARVASGIDAAAVTPVRGSRRGGSGSERMTVEVSVEIAQQ